MVQTKNVRRFNKSFHTFMNGAHNTGHRGKSGLFAYNPNPLTGHNPRQTYQNQSLVANIREFLAGWSDPTLHFIAL